MDGVLVSIPARSGYVQLVRSVVAGIGANLNLSIEEIDDLRLAVDEACNHLLGRSAPGAVLTLEVAPRNGMLRIEAVVSTAADGDGGDPAGDEFSLAVLQALTDEALLAPAGSGRVVRIGKRLSSADADR